MKVSKQTGLRIAALINTLQTAEIVIKAALQKQDTKAYDLFVDAYNEAADELNALNIPTTKRV
jgi:hypothetical protein